MLQLLFKKLTALVMCRTPVAKYSSLQQHIHARKQDTEPPQLGQRCGCITEGSKGSYHLCTVKIHAAQPVLRLAFMEGCVKLLTDRLVLNRTLANVKTIGTADMGRDMEVHMRTCAFQTG